MKFSHNISRVEAFSDAVFAFAATLMVVSIDLNENFILMKSRAFSLLTFGVSFFVLVALWMVHYNYFRRVGYIDNWVIALNSMLLFMVLYYVFPLKSLINTWIGEDKITLQNLSELFQMYSVGFLLIFLCFALMYRRAYKKMKSHEKCITALFYSRHFGIYVIVGAISVAISIFKLGVSFGLPGMIYFLLGPFCYLHSKWFDKKFRNNTL
ncbi:TMEM175 family protein [Flagellimonas allohymeniacidonis]|uniref:DUF1211 domain-containing protein n=1 Tax=Flagellimonas allohymeniacidonis TaxID=2517819 RepID=A0A4Q8QFI7_9FLAO|nr:TMEM175 family protein [Allomuricauda hymeniacidonis]TAI49201.1 DUF1211 domain-containing protein [Allomuricauda hymeniacidonis]